MLKNFTYAFVAVLLLLGSVSAYARNIQKRELEDVQLDALSLNDDPTIAVTPLERFNELLQLNAAYNIILGSLRCLPGGSECFFLYPELCCSGMCKLTPEGPFGSCLGN